jgi:ribonuclease HI
MGHANEPQLFVFRIVSPWDVRSLSSTRRSPRMSRSNDKPAESFRQLASKTFSVELPHKETTNNRMELRACVRALEYIRERVPFLKVSRVIIVTDSLYLHDYHRIAVHWKKQKWLNLDGRAIENSNLWNELISLRAKIRVPLDIQWSKGKTSAILKEVDRRAKAAATRPTEIDRGFRGGKLARSKVKTKQASTLFPAQGQEVVVNIYRKRLPGKGEDKIYFDLFSEDQREFTAKHHAFTSAAIATELHRSHYYKVRFNSDPKHPFIEAIITEITPFGLSPNLSTSTTPLRNHSQH